MTSIARTATHTSFSLTLPSYNYPPGAEPPDYPIPYVALHDVFTLRSHLLGFVRVLFFVLLVLAQRIHLLGFLWIFVGFVFRGFTSTCSGTQRSFCSIAHKTQTGSEAQGLPVVRWLSHGNKS